MGTPLDDEFYESLNGGPLEPALAPKQAPQPIARQDFTYPTDDDDVRWQLLYRQHGIPLTEPRARAVEFIQADAIRDEIYRRHGIEPGTPLADAVVRIEDTAVSKGSGASMWANEDERGKARAEYAAQGKNPAEVKRRWQESEYLLDPRSYEYMQNYGRDADFLESALRSQQASPSARQLDYNAIRHYEASKGNRLSGAGGWNPMSMPSSYQRFDTWTGALGNNMMNPDEPVGNYFMFGGVPADFLRTYLSGEAGSGGEASNRANAFRLANNRYRLGSPHPIGDLPDGASPAEIAARMKELQAEVASASIPGASERWYRQTGVLPPGFVSDDLDLLMGWADPSALIPAGSALGATRGAVKAAAKGSQIAGKGWTSAAVKNAYRPVLAGLAGDGKVEGAVEGALKATTGGLPGRSWGEYLFGNWSPDEEEMKARGFRTDEQVQASRRDGEALHARLKEDDGVSRANNEAYDSLAERGLLGPLEQQRARLFGTQRTKESSQ